MNAITAFAGVFAVVCGLLTMTYGTPKEGAVPSGLLVVMLGIWILGKP